MSAYVKSHCLQTLLQDPSSAALIRRTFQQRMNDPPILSFGALPKQARPGQLQDSGLALRFSAVSTALPLNVHLLTLKALPQDSVLLRLAHLYQVSPLMSCDSLISCEHFKDQVSRDIEHWISVQAGMLQMMIQQQQMQKACSMQCCARVCAHELRL